MTRRGEIRLVTSDPVVGSEADERRPGVVVSNDRSNAVVDRLGRGVVTVVPVTSNIRHVLPFQVLLPASSTGLRVDSKAQAEQVRSVGVERLGPAIGRVPGALRGRRRGPPPAPGPVAQYRGRPRSSKRARRSCQGRERDATRSPPS